MNVEDTNFDELNYKANVIYRFVMTYSDYMKESRDYGTGDIINMVEIHTLTFVEENPGITVTEIATMWKRTKGASSQIVAKLEHKGLIERRKERNNAKNLHLYVTDQGLALSKAHKQYDVKELTWANQILHQEFSEQEINAFYKVMQRYTELMSLPRTE